MAAPYDTMRCASASQAAYLLRDEVGDVLGDRECRGSPRGRSDRCRVGASCAQQPVGLQLLQELAHEERIAAGLLAHRFGERRRRVGIDAATRRR